MDKKQYPDILTKENFWNELNEKYPEQMKVFCAWIDEYKKRVEWDRLFQYGNMKIVPPGQKLATSLAPKFHEIPIAMQIGIILEFIMSQELDFEQLKMDMLTMVRNMIETIKV